jgi:micrococcal nuclease
MKRKREKILLVFLVLILIALNYNSINGFLIKNLDTREMVKVERVIDGDTVVVNGISVRLLGINTPERGERYYSEAKEFLEGKVMNKTIYIERKGKDRYYRDLGYLFLFSGENINSEIVKEGYANYYFPSGKDNYYDEFVSSWDKCINSEKNLCEKSKYECVILKELDIKNQAVILENKCNYNINMNNWEIKDEGRKKFVFGDIELEDEIVITNEDFKQDYVWTDSGDTLFLRDDAGKLVLWESY